MEENPFQKAIGELDAEKAFKFVEFYEDAGSTVKGRTWTITTWILTIDSALIAFCFQLYMSHSDIFGFLYIQFAVCAAGYNFRLVLKWLRTLLRKFLAALFAELMPRSALNPAC